MTSSGGEAEREKSAKTIVSGSEEVCVPLVPLTLKERGLGVDPERPLTAILLEPPGLMDVGLKVQLPPVTPTQLRVMPLLNPLWVAAKMVNGVEAVPMVMVVLLLSAERVKRAIPIPDKPTVCGLPLALSVIATLPVLLPLPFGVKVTVMVQLAPTATDPLVPPEGMQVLVWV